jgi:hypothetical protein
LSNKILIILYVIDIVRFILKTLSNDANFKQTIFVYLEQFLIKNAQNEDALFIAMEEVGVFMKH